MNTCDEGNNSTTVSKSTCVTGRQYMLAADGEPAIFCTPAQSASVALDEPNNSATKNNSAECVPKEDAFQNKENGEIGIVVGAVITILLLTAGGIAYCLWRQRRKRRSRNNSSANQINEEEAKKDMLKEHDNNKNASVP